jgi:hypothetical protein
MCGTSDYSKKSSPCHFSQNSTTEIFSLLKFLQIAPLDNWTVFNSEIEKQLKTVGQSKLKVCCLLLSLKDCLHLLLDGSKAGHALADTNIEIQWKTYSQPASQMNSLD